MIEKHKEKTTNERTNERTKKKIHRPSRWHSVNNKPSNEIDGSKKNNSRGSSCIKYYAL